MPRTSGPGGIDVELFDAEGIRVLDFMVNPFTSADPRLVLNSGGISRGSFFGPSGSAYGGAGIRSNSLGYARVPFLSAERISIMAWSDEIPAFELTDVRCPRPGERTTTLTLRAPANRILTTVQGLVKRKDGTPVEGAVVRAMVDDRTIPTVTLSWLNAANLRAVTNSTGQFVMRGIEPGVHFKMSAEIGYCKVAEEKLAPLDHQESRRVDFVVPETRSVTIIVTHEGRSLPGVSIGCGIAYKLEAEPIHTTSGATTDSNGHAVVVVPQGLIQLDLSIGLQWRSPDPRSDSSLMGGAPFQEPKTELWSYLSRLRADPVEYSREDCDQPISLELRDYFQSAIAHWSGQEAWPRLRAFVDSGQWDAKDFDPIALDAIRKDDPLRLCCHLFAMRRAFGFVPATPDR